MNALVRKEIRAVVPLWIIGLVSVIAPMVIVDIANSPEIPRVPLWLLCFAVGLPALVCSTNTFGQEFRHGTFQSLLAQPISRDEIWWTKVIVSGTAVASLVFVLFFVHDSVLRGGLAGPVNWDPLSPDTKRICWMIVAAVFAGGLWTTLALRQEVLAFCVSLLIPTAACFLSFALLREYSTEVQLRAVMTVLALYSVASVLLAKALFTRAQDLQWSGGTIALPGWFAGSQSGRSTRGRVHTPIAGLIRKELQVQQVSWLCGILLIVLLLGIVTMRGNAGKASSLQNALMLAWFLLWLALPLLAGGIAVAEERRLGTFENLLCLPTSRRLQFALKLAVSMALVVTFCAVVPWLIMHMGFSHQFQGWPLQELFSGRALPFLVLLFALMTFVSFYVSTQTRATLAAVGLGFVLNLPSLMLGVWIYGTLFDTSQNHTLWELPLIVHVLLLTMLTLWFVLAWRNFNSLHAGGNLAIRNVLWNAGGLLFAFALTAFVYHRTWEKFVRLEPRHGPARLSGPVRPQIAYSYHGLLVLLPDGRLWVNTAAEWVHHRDEGFIEPMPRGGQFLPFTNWISLASRQSEAMAVRADGTLWRIEFPALMELVRSRASEIALPIPRRMGQESNWLSVAGTFDSFVALKTSGTVWEWRRDDTLRGDQSTADTNRFVQVTGGSDWRDIYASGGTAIGVKHDGSVWKWGRLTYLPDGTQPKNSTDEPVNWHLNGSNWVERVGNFYDIFLLPDGSLWGSGFLPKNILGNEPHFALVREPRRIRPDRKWADVASTDGRTSAIDSKGRLELSSPELVWGVAKWRAPSRYSDWIAVECTWNESIALAADGTLSSWANSRSARSCPEDLLGLSRRPRWSLNIFNPPPGL